MSDPSLTTTNQSAWRIPAPVERHPVRHSLLHVYCGLTDWTSYLYREGQPAPIRWCTERMAVMWFHLHHNRVYDWLDAPHPCKWPSP